MTAFHPKLNTVVHGFPDEKLPNLTDGFIDTEMTTNRGLMVRTENNGNKVVGQNDPWLSVKFGNTAEEPISHRIRSDRFTSLEFLNYGCDLGILGLMRS
jgi:hypothetical protein